MIPEKFRKRINEDLVMIWGRQQYSWKSLNKGFVNSSLVAFNENNEPLMVCKFYPEDEIYIAEERRDRENSAYNFMANRNLMGLISPSSFTVPDDEYIAYFFVEGTELHLTEIDDEVKTFIERTLKKLHDSRNQSKERNNPPLPKEVTEYYEMLLQRFSSSEHNYPQELLVEFEGLIKEQACLLEKYSDHLTFVHGDLVPPNIIVDKSVEFPPGNREPVVFIDWEFYRPELSFFDYVYFNYYAGVHKLPIYLEVEKEVEDFYVRLVDVLERLWRFGYEIKHKKPFKTDDSI